MGPHAVVTSTDVITPQHPLILGSASPRRREILEGLGLPLVVLPGAALEQAWQGQNPEDHVAQVVEAKLEAVAGRLGGWSFGAVLVADTIVVVGTEVLGKPDSVADAERLLGLLVGRTHTVLTRYAIAGPGDPRTPLVARTVRSEVTMRAATSDEIARYALTGEGLDKAGAYAAQGIGCFLVERITGSYTNVVGLPACEVVLDLRDARLLGPFP
jgi:septum formation protein